MALRESFWMLNRDSSVEYLAPLLWCPTAMFMVPMQLRSDVRWRQRHTNNRSSCEQSSFMQSARHSLPGHGPYCSSRELRRQLVLDLLVSSGVWRIATGSDRLPLW
ncbi:hypothetical protein AVEN_160925-1 [Araneus ventricosus]|uniref:Uncharacterized protein n=1 Tax=Araneus ventricosus TaxID=182803 RepID=A0A4Y2TAU4_ARAVE|nr:hypothetical protein AVEN_160925-1 [Araneus ventricosus]